MSDLIPAAPGWRYVYWENEHDGPMALPIVAWRAADSRRGDGSTALLPLVLSYCGSEVAEPRKDALFVAVIPPGAEFSDYFEAAEDVAKAQREAEDRDYEQRGKATT